MARGARWMVMFVAVAGALAAPARAEDARNYRIGADHRGYTQDAALAGPLEERWSQRLGSQLSYPIVADGKVFVSAWSQVSGMRLYALDRDTGDVLWWREAAGTPVYDGGRVFAIDGVDVIRAFDTDDGALAWEVELPILGDTRGRGLVADGGVLYVGAGDRYGGELWAVDAATGAAKWTRYPFWGLYGRPAVARGRIYASGGSCGLVYTFTTSGDGLWQSANQCTGSTETAPIVGEAAIHVPDGGLVHSFSDADGSRLTTRYEQRLVPALAPGALVSVTSAGEIRAEDPLTGVAAWARRPDARIASSPIVVGDRAFVALADGTLEALSMATGDRTWSGDLRAAVPDEDQWNAVLAGGLTAGEGTLLATAGGRLVAFAAPAGVRVTGGPVDATNADGVRFEVLGDGAECRLDPVDGAWAPCAGAFERDNLAEGAYAFRARAGGAETVRHFTVDRVPPAVTIRYQPNDLGRVDYTADEDARFECRLVSDGAWKPCPAAWEIGGFPQQSDERFAVRATDVAGNVSVVEHRVDEDLADPEIQVRGGPAGTVGETAAEFSPSSSEPVDWRCRLDGADWSACPRPLRYEGLADGPHELRVQGFDAVGRPSNVVTRQWIVSTQDGAPAPTPTPTPRATPTPTPTPRAASSPGVAAAPAPAPGSAPAAPPAAGEPAGRRARLAVPRRVARHRALRMTLRCPATCVAKVVVRRPGGARVGTRTMRLRHAGTRSFRVPLRAGGHRLVVTWRLASGGTVQRGKARLRRV